MVVAFIKEVLHVDANILSKYMPFEVLDGQHANSCSTNHSFFYSSMKLQSAAFLWHFM